MDQGGIENWLVNLVQHGCRQQFTHSILAQSGRLGQHAQLATDLGATMLSTRPPSTGLLYALDFIKALYRAGPFDIVHSHVHHFNGVVLALARLTGVRTLVAHAHSDTRTNDRTAKCGRRAYVFTMKTLTGRLATQRIAASAHAAAAQSQLPDTPVIHCGINISRYQRTIQSHNGGRPRPAPSGKIVIGHVGRFVEAKNHTLIIAIAEAIRAIGIPFEILLIGDGPLAPRIKRLSKERGLDGHVKFLGVRDDVAELLVNSVDVMLMPSLFEGLPLVGIEAQTAGLPLVLSDTITSELEVISEHFHRHSLSDPPEAWAKTLIMAATTSTLNRESCAAIMATSSFSIEKSCEAIQSAYQAMLRGSLS